jgi:hypothetical protein
MTKMGRISEAKIPSRSDAVSGTDPKMIFRG